MGKLFRLGLPLRFFVNTYLIRSSKQSESDPSNEQFHTVNDDKEQSRAKALSHNLVNCREESGTFIISYFCQFFAIVLLPCGMIQLSSISSKNFKFESKR